MAPPRRAPAHHADRLALALDLLRDPAFDVLLTGTRRWRSCPGDAALADGDLPGLCHTIYLDDAGGGHVQRDGA